MHRLYAHHWLRWHAGSATLDATHSASQQPGGAHVKEAGQKAVRAGTQAVSEAVTFQLAAHKLFWALLPLLQVLGLQPACA